MVATRISTWDAPGAVAPRLSKTFSGREAQAAQHKPIANDTNAAQTVAVLMPNTSCRTPRAMGFDLTEVFRLSVLATEQINHIRANDCLGLCLAFREQI